MHSVHKIAESRKDADRIAVQAGLDMHMHGGEFLDNIKAWVKEGIISEERINESVRKILKAKFQLGLFEKRYINTNKVNNVVLNAGHRQLALESARRSIVLLNNKNNLLPLQNINSIFITGPNANNQSLLGDWSRIQPEENVITVLEGIKNNAASNTTIDFFDCGEIHSIQESVIKEAGIRAQKSDIAVVVVGENSIRENPNKTSGENLDRSSLELAGRQLELIKSVASAGKPVIVISINGAPIASEWCAENIPAILEAWEPGMMGGQAVADILFGKYNPSGKLPITFPRSSGHVQSFYNYKPSAFHRGKFYDDKTDPLYEFGYGLSYTDFTYSNLEIPASITKTEALKIKSRNRKHR